jgi:lysyl-tRNA synthetase class 2
MEELFLKHCGFSLLSHLEAPNLYACMRKEGIYAQEGDDYAMLFHRAFMSRIAPALARAGEAAFLCDYPAPLASLSALDPKDPRIAQRLEFFMGDLELGNGFQECRCAETQRARFDEAHAWHKKHMGQGYLHDNAAFLAALPQMPECVGMAIGWERLLASILNCASLAELEELSWQAV